MAGHFAVTIFPLYLTERQAVCISIPKTFYVILMVFLNYFLSLSQPLPCPYLCTRLKIHKERHCVYLLTALFPMPTTWWVLSQFC